MDTLELRRSAHGKGNTYYDVIFNGVLLERETTKRVGQETFEKYAKILRTTKTGTINFIEGVTA